LIEIYLYIKEAIVEAVTVLKYGSIAVNEMPPTDWFIPFLT
jgi:hypothetical protein